MKMLLALLALMPLTSFAYEYGECRLTASHYLHKSILNYEYVLTRTETLDSTWVELRNSDETLTGNAGAAKYTVTFELDGKIRGSLRLNTNTPGSKDLGFVDHNEELRLSAEHVFSSGKTVYNLYCSLDKH